MPEQQIGVLKSLWSRGPDGRWRITDLKGLDLTPRPGCHADYFTFESDLELMTTTPSSNLAEMFASFGSTDFLLKQSIVPVVVWGMGSDHIRCIGTASVISCSGYLLTAAHVIMDLYESGFAVREGNKLRIKEGLWFGTFIPMNPAQWPGKYFCPIQEFRLWGEWKDSPLVGEPDKFEYLTDIAVCKIPGMPAGAAHQPLTLSLHPFAPGEIAFALGYAEMEDVPLEWVEGLPRFGEFSMEMYASVGEVMQTFPENHLRRDVPTPGPCFDFRAKIPGKMSGAPIFGAGGAVVRGVVSRSFTNERHAFGAMLGPATTLSLDVDQRNGRTLKSLIETGDEGMPHIQGNPV